MTTSPSSFPGGEHLVLCVGDNVSSHEPVTAAASLAGCEPLAVEDWNQAIALFFVDRRIEAVVLDYRGKESVGICLAQALHSLRRDIPVLLISAKNIDKQPKGVDVCVCMEEDSADLARILQSLLHPRNSH